MSLPHRSLVLGGANSGKSRLAETWALGSGRPLVYLATAEVRDDEMAAKVARHAARRGADWQVVETGYDISPALAAVDPGAVVLLDCATLWLMGWIEAGGAADAAPDEFCAALAACPASVIVVSNEMGLGGIAADRASRHFAAVQGALNQSIARTVDLVALSVAGLPLVLKGALP